MQNPTLVITFDTDKRTGTERRVACMINTHSCRVFDGFVIIFNLNVRFGSVQVQNSHFRAQFYPMRISAYGTNIIEFLHKRTVKKFTNVN